MRVVVNSDAWTVEAIPTVLQATNPISDPPLASGVGFFIS